VRDDVQARGHGAPPSARARVVHSRARRGFHLPHLRLPGIPAVPPRGRQPGRGPGMTPRPAGIAGVFAWLFALAAPAALPPEQHLLPPETIGFVLVPDAGPARAAWETQAPARLWRDPGMREV